MTAKQEKLTVMLTAFVLFLGGVFALSMDRGDGRTIVLWGCMAALLAIAVRQTVKRLKKR